MDGTHDCKSASGPMACQGRAALNSGMVERPPLLAGSSGPHFRQGRAAPTSGRVEQPSVLAAPHQHRALAQARLRPHGVAVP
eukprot:355721-Chlamydomonas_euryale.AAC.1